MTFSPHSGARFEISDELLSAYVDGQVTAAERQRVEEAVAAAPEVAQRLHGLQMTVALLRQASPAPVPRAFVLSEQQVLASGGRVTGARAPSFFTRLLDALTPIMPLATAAVAAVLVLAVGLATWPRQNVYELASAPQEIALAPAPAGEMERAGPPPQATVVVEMAVEAAPADGPATPAEDQEAAVAGGEAVTETAMAAMAAPEPIPTPTPAPAEGEGEERAIQSRVIEESPTTLRVFAPTPTPAEEQDAAMAAQEAITETAMAAKAAPEPTPPPPPASVEEENAAVAAEEGITETAMAAQIAPETAPAAEENLPALTEEDAAGAAQPAAEEDARPAARLRPLIYGLVGLLALMMATTLLLRRRSAR